MINIIEKDRSKLIKAATGQIPCDISIENAQLVNVVTGEIYKADVDILDGIIVRIREEHEGALLPAKEIIDAKGMYLLPGFIDTHMHVESSLLVPENFGKAAVVWGTTTAITDPHEIANVLGVDGVKYMLESAKRSPLRQFALIPSCIPSLPGFEEAGAVFDAKDVEALLSEDKVLGIAEVMDYIGVINDDPRMHDIIAVGDKQNVFIQGHAPGQTGAGLAAYLLGGPISDHENLSGPEVLAKRRNGMRINARIHSISDALNLLEGMKPGLFHDTISLCTDDVNAYRLQSKGHINSAVADLVEAGEDPISAIRYATLNAAREYRLSDAGAIAPGYVADVQLVKTLDFKERPAMVFVAGQLMAKDGVFLGEKPQKAWYDKGNTVFLTDINSADDFRIPATDREDINVMVVNEGYEEDIIVREKLKPENGFYEIPKERREDVNYICVLNRHGKPNKSIALYSELVIKNGAVATSVAHDSHNICVIYSNAEDAYLAVKELENCGGGVCLVQGGETKALLRLPVAGLMSDLPLDLAAEECRKVEEAVSKQCNISDFTLHNLLFLTLPVFPRYTPTDLGVVNGPKMEFIQIID
ncbi:MAG: adenine deaminase [Clostridiales bacterium]|nr:adenine deaminase [Clostridiales bacterium]